jgi:hypothetical protein
MIEYDFALAVAASASTANVNNIFFIVDISLLTLGRHTHAAAQTTAARNRQARFRKPVASL